MPETFTLNPDWHKNRDKLLNYLAVAGLVSGGVGAGVTGLSGLHRLRQMQKERPEALPGNVPVHMPISRMPPSEDEKTAEEVPAGHWKHLVGQAADSVSGMPIAYAALPIASIGAMLGGSHLANKYLHNKMKALRQQRFDQAQGEFDQAMMDKYDSNGLGSAKLGAALDQLYDVMEKDAALTAQELQALAAAEAHQWDAVSPPPPPPPPPTSEMDESSSAAVLGLPSIAAMLSGSLGLRAGYNWGEGRKPENLLRDALAQRAMLRSRSMPEPITLRPMSAPRKAAKQEEAKTTDE